MKPFEGCHFLCSHVVGDTDGTGVIMGVIGEYVGISVGDGVGFWLGSSLSLSDGDEEGEEVGVQISSCSQLGVPNTALQQSSRVS